MRWQLGEELYLTGVAAEMAITRQEEHREMSGREGLIQEFVEKPIPSDWQKWTLDRRRDYWAGGVVTPQESPIVLVPRDRICALEVWCELFGGSSRDAKMMDMREINSVLARLPGWERTGKTGRFGPHGIQRGFTRAG